MTSNQQLLEFINNFTNIITENDARRCTLDITKEEEGVYRIYTMLIHKVKDTTDTVIRKQEYVIFPES